jgi:hypothetical protein
MSVILEDAVRRAKWAKYSPAPNDAQINLLKARVAKLEHELAWLQTELDKKVDRRKPSKEVLGWSAPGQQPSMREIMLEVCDTFCTTIELLLSDTRQKALVKPRWIAMYLCDRLTGKPGAEIGRRFKRDHTTVIHGIRQVRRERDYDAQFDHQLKMLEKRIMSSRPSSDQPSATTEALATDYTLGESHEPLAPCESDGRETT